MRQYEMRSRAELAVFRDQAHQPDGSHIGQSRMDYHGLYSFRGVEHNSHRVTVVLVRSNRAAGRNPFESREVGCRFGTSKCAHEQGRFVGTPLEKPDSILETQAA